jgi:tRNA-Thr(GGU) m(6)t(6)A37 methyltransferase TsaA
MTAGGRDDWDDGEKPEIVPVGVIRSSVKERSKMPLQGVAGRVEIFPEYREALDGIEFNSHLILLCWMHQGRRDLLKARARKVSSDLPEKGVFALRSPDRPNPISFSIIRLLGKSDEGILQVDNLDLIDGTPVLDIKPYQPGWDAVFSATTHDRTKKIQKMGISRYRESLIREAVNYHGEWCAGAAVAVRIAEIASELVGGDLRRPDISVDPGTDGCLADAIIGITGARPGNGRIRFTSLRESQHPMNNVKFFCPGGICIFSLESIDLAPDAVLDADEDQLFSLLCSDFSK